MNRIFGWLLSICIALAGLATMLFGVSGSNAIVEQAGESDSTMVEQPMAGVRLLKSPTQGEIAYVPMGNENGLALIDTVLHTTLDNLDLAQYGCYHPLRARLNPDGTELYLTCENSHNIIVLDTANLSLVAVIERPGACEQDVAFVQSGQYALASSGNTDCDEVHDIAVIDTATHTIVQNISIPGYFIISIAAHPFLPLAYAASYQCCYSGSVMVIDTNTFSVQTVIPFGTITWGMQPSRDGQWVYASDYYGQQGVIKIDPQTNQVVDSTSGLGELFGLQISPDGSRLFVAGGWQNTVYVLDTADMSLITSIGVGGRTSELALTCDGSELYVAQEGNTIPVIDTHTYQVTHNISIPGTNTSYGITICPPYVAHGAFLSPPSQNGYAEAGKTLTYSLQMVNLAGRIDSFDLELLPGNAWTTTLSTDQVGPIADGEMVSFTAQVEIPVDAQPGNSDAAVIQATSVTSPTDYTSTATIRTTTSGGMLAYVPMGNENALALIDTTLHATVGSVDLARYGCNQPNKARLNPDGTELYVMCENSHSIIVLETTNLSLVAMFNRLDACTQDVAFVQFGAYALASTNPCTGGPQPIDVIDTKTHTIVQSIPSDYGILSMAAHPYLPLAYAAAFQGSYSGAVLVINTNTFTIQTVIPFGVIVSGVQPSQDGQWVYASDYFGQQGVIKMDAQTNQVLGSASGMGELFGMQITPDGSRLFVAGGWSETIFVLDTADMSLITSIGVGGITFEMALTCDGSELYVAREGSAIPVIDTQTYRIIHNISIPGTNGSAGITICPPSLINNVALLPASQERSGVPGEVVTYVESLRNVTGITDTFNLSFANNSWQTTLSDTSLGPLVNGQAATFTVSVKIPSDAPWYLTDTVMITATSVTSPALTAAGQITTTAYAPPQISVSPAALTGTLYANQVATQTLNISNGYGVTLTYTINVGGGLPKNIASLYPDEPQGSTTSSDTPGSGKKVACSGDTCPAVYRSVAEMRVYLPFIQTGWLLVDPPSGSVPTSSSSTVQVAFYAKNLPPGVYRTILFVYSNDPLDPIVQVPVIMTILSDEPLFIGSKGP